MTSPEAEGLRPELEESDDSPRDYPEPPDGEQNTDYPNGDDTTEETGHGGSVG